MTTTPIPITDELVKLFIEEHLHGIEEAALDRWQKFLASRQVKGWEIVSFKSHELKEWIWKLEGRIYINNTGFKFTLNRLLNGEDGSACVADGRMYINEVRRLPSNEVFTVGEQTQEGKIERFFIVNGEMCVDTELPFDCDLSELHKLPIRKPIFVTEDNIEVFEDFIPLTIVHSSFAITSLSAHLAAEYKLKYPHDKLFSTRAAAEKYVKENRPVYSEAMVWKALQASFIGSAYIKDVFSNLEKQANKNKQIKE